MGKPITQFSIVLLCALLAVSCNKSKCWKSWGNDAVANLEVQSFHTIELQDHIRLELVNGAPNTQQVEIRAGNNLIDHVKAEVRDETLWISDNNTCDWLRDYDHEIVVSVTVPPALKTIRHMGTSDMVSLDTLRLDTLTINMWNAGGNVNLLLTAARVNSKIHTGPGDITLAGRTQLHTVHCTGNGYLNASEFNSTTAWITNGGTGDVHVTVSTSMTAKLSGTGSVFYRGNPVIVSQEISGSGQLLPF